MSLTFAEMARCVEQAARWQPNGVSVIADFCGEYYSPYYGFFIFAMGIPGPDRHKRTAVELGCDQGRGLISLAYGGGNSSNIIGIDHTRKVGMDKALQLFPYITFIEADSDPPPPDVPDNIYLLHIDTEHSHAQAQAEFNAYKGKLAKPSIVVFDDLHAREDDVLRYFNSLPYPKIQDDRLHPTCGWGVILFNE